MKRRRFDDRLAAGEDYEVGKSAAYHCQIESFGLMPWQSPPCYADMSALNEPYGDPPRVKVPTWCCECSAVASAAGIQIPRASATAPNPSSTILRNENPAKGLGNV